MPSTSPNGRKLIENFEGLRLDAYWDSYGGVWTIGYGHTGHDVNQTTHWSQQQADEALAKDLKSFESSLAQEIKVSISQNMWDALMSFIYNLGAGCLANSSMLALINEEKFEDAATHFNSYVYAGGVALPGLITRRASEKKLFLTGLPQKGK